MHLCSEYPPSVHMVKFFLPNSSQRQDHIGLGSPIHKLICHWFRSSIWCHSRQNRECVWRTWADHLLCDVWRWSLIVHSHTTALRPEQNIEVWFTNEGFEKFPLLKFKLPLQWKLNSLGTLVHLSDTGKKIFYFQILTVSVLQNEVNIYNVKCTCFHCQLWEWSGTK